MLLRELYEAPNKTAVMAFGRMNPPTIGHAKLVDVVKSKPGDPFIFLSQSQKPKTDPLPFVEKLRYAKFFFPNVTIGSGDVKTIIGALQKIESLGYKNLIYVAGSDRVENFKELINKYNGKDYVFDNIDVVSAGERDPDAEGAEGMSASKMRQAAADNNFELFSQGVPQKELAGEMFAAVKKGMGVSEQKINDIVGENLTTADIPVVNYDRNYGGDINKVLAVKPNAQKDAQAIYDKLGGVSHENYEKMSALVQAKIQELRNVYRNAVAQKGLKGAAALRSPEYLLFRKQSNDLKIMSSTAMSMIDPNASSATSTGSNVYMKGPRGGQMAKQAGFIPKDTKLPPPGGYKSIADYKAANPDKVPMSLAQFKAQNPGKVQTARLRDRARRRGMT